MAKRLPAFTIELSGEVRIVRRDSMNFTLETLEQVALYDGKPGKGGTPTGKYESRWVRYGFYSSLRQCLTAAPSAVAFCPAVNTLEELEKRWSALIDGFAPAVAPICAWDIKGRHTNEGVGNPKVQGSDENGSSTLSVALD